MEDPTVKIDAFFSKATRWYDAFAVLRALVLKAGLTEEFKWRGPCYTHAGGNVAILGGFKNFCALTFFKGVLLKDEKGLLAPPGDNSRIARVFRVTDVAQIHQAEADLMELLQQAMKLEAEGVKVDLPEAEPDLPEELVAALEDDAELAEAFAALTPGRQRGWAITIGQAKQAATRVARIAKARPQILAGKGIHDR
ncbi:YdeI/OmpD-associated family protein [Thioclava sp. FR2]|uniref:YdeI/OmpD-associated family protein n=1 Tax=Thioclava sp. FR2 TaxID=3445780 RepID=UPI003EB95E93